VFELIGLLVGTFVFFAFSGLMGVIYALLAWLILRGLTRRRRYVIVAALLPPMFALYIAVCTIGFSVFVPGESGRLFGDISEPLPNGYVIQALGKMPDYGHIDRRDDEKSGYPQGFRGYIGRVAVDGSLVFGAYSHTSTEPRDGGYFVFNTQSGSARNFDTLPELNGYVGHPVELTQIQFFRSQEISHKSQIKVERSLMFGPPILGTLLYVFLLLQIRRTRDAARAI
jgi:hypothetical protein